MIQTEVPKLAFFGGACLTKFEISKLLRKNSDISSFFVDITLFEIILRSYLSRLLFSVLTSGIYGL